MGTLGGCVSGSLWIDWTALAISLFNTVLLIWLGVTVLLNAERRTIGVILAITGLLTGALFFIVHTTILAQGALSMVQNYDFWWHVGWPPVMITPYAWYMVVLWYSGFWDDRQSKLYHRHILWVLTTFFFTLGLVFILMIARPWLGMSFVYEANLALKQGLGWGYIPFLMLAYPLNLEIILSLDALIRPAPSGRVMGDLARRRAHPWLIATSLIFFVISMVVGITLFVLLQTVRSPYSTLSGMISNLLNTLSLIDLLLAFLVMITILTIGQAVVSYEIFTGKTLPRRGILGEWRKMILLATIFSALAAACVVLQIRTIYTLLLVLLLMALYFAFLSWRNIEIREQNMRELRPFVTSQRLLDQVLQPGEDSLMSVDVQAPFDALCQNMLGAGRGALIPLGPLAALVSQPLYYPRDQVFDFPLFEVLSKFTSPQMMGLPLDPIKYAGAAWVLPLWSERGLNGVIVLGEKNDGGFFSQEEIELARSAGERLTDVLATVELSRRLMSLQRQRLAQSQVIDRKTRRVLHDDVLPQLHTSLLQLSAIGIHDGEEIIASLSETHRLIANLLREMPPPDAPDVIQLGLIRALHRVVEHELAHSFDDVRWQIDPEAERKSADLSPLTIEVFFYAAREVLRNAAHHAKPASLGRVFSLSINLHQENGLVLVIRDNGVGLGRTHQSLQGSGQGLALHSTMMAVVGGSLSLESVPNEFTQVTLKLP